MARRLDPKEELMVLICIKDLKEATLQEIQTYIREKHNIELEDSRLTRYIRRWQKGKYISGNLVGDEWAFSVRDIPWWPETQLINVLRPEISTQEAKLFLENYKEEVKERGSIVKPEPDIKNYRMFKIMMETVDEVAGGLLSDDEKKLLFPRQGNNLVIPRGWLKGYFRDNIRLVNGLGSHVLNYFGFSVGEFTEQPKIREKTVIGKKGPQTHEVIPPGSKFEFELGFPTHGSVLRNKDELVEMLNLAERIPIRGMGAYARAFGGRVKLTNVQEFD